MLAVEDLLEQPGTPEMVVSEAEQINGLDLLGLRSPAEAVANYLMNGVTTVTPNVGYLALRCWLILRYLELGGLKSWAAFYAFAAKAEAAIAYASVLLENETTGVVGRDKAYDAISSSDGVLALKQLTEELAVGIYAGTSQGLGLGGNSGDVPSITRERGEPLGKSFASAIGKDSLLRSISVTEQEQPVSREELVEFGRGFNFLRPSSAELAGLINAIMPGVPREQGQRIELNRIASYCLFLHLARTLQRCPTESDIYATATQLHLTGVPEELHGICDGWLHFTVRDLLVLVHEAAVKGVLHQLQQAPGDEKRMPVNVVLSALVSEEIDSSLSGLELTVNADQPISELCSAVQAALGEKIQVRGLLRWAGKLSETLIFEKRAWLRNTPGLGLLPVSWILAASRFQSASEQTSREFLIDREAGIYRIGVETVVLPEVKNWCKSMRSIREVTGWLVKRSVDQHLRIAWSRQCADPRRDVSLIRSDGDQWVYQNDFRPDRATSRIYQAVNWLRQLGQIDDAGITAQGSALLETGLATLRRASGDANEPA